MSEPSAVSHHPRPPATGSLPVRPLLLWALLVPLAYAPALAIGDRFDAALATNVALATALALLGVGLLANGRIPDRLAARLEPAAPVLLALACAGYAAISIARAAAALARFEPHVIAGIFGQSFWSLLRGQPFANSMESIDGTMVSHFGVHFSPTLLVLAPFYALAPNPLTLLAGQALALALAPVPLFALLRPRVGGAAALLLALSLFALPIFARAAGGDFHDSCFLPAPLLAAVWALEARRTRALAAFALLALGVREDAGISVAVLGVWALLRGRGVAVGLALIALGLGWLAIATRFVVPAFGSPGIIIDSKRFFEAAYGHWGATPGQALRRWLADPLALLSGLATREQALYLYALLRPLLLVPPILDTAVLLALPALALNLLSRFTFMHSATEPYSYVPITFLALAVSGLATRLASRAPAERRSAAGLVAAVIVIAGALPSGLEPAARPAVPVLPVAAARSVVDRIPRDAAVYAPEVLYPAMCNRARFDCRANTPALERGAEFPVRYAWIVLWPAGDPRDRALADSLAADPRFIRHQGTEPLVVFERY